MEQLPSRDELIKSDIERAQDDLEKLKATDDKESTELAKTLEQTVQAHLREEEKKMAGQGNIEEAA